MVPGMSKETNIDNGNLSTSRKWFHGNCSAHWHEFYEIEYVIEGNGTYEINGHTFLMEKGMLYFMTPTDFHSVSTQKAELINIMFSGDLVSPSLLATFTCHAAPKAIALPKEQQAFFMALLEEVVAHQKDPAYATALLGCLLLKLARILSFAEDQFNSASQKVYFYMINHFRDKMTLQDAAQYVGLTPSYLSAVFKKEMNKNFKTALDEIRFSYAQKLLLYSDMTVTQICIESGFDDYPNFIRRFKKFFGVTPTQMRADAALIR